MATPPKTKPPVQNMLAEVTAKCTQAKKYYEECEAWAEHLSQVRAEKEQRVREAQREMVDIAKQQTDAVKKAKQAKEAYEKWDEEEDKLSDLVCPKTRAWQWAAAAEAARKPHTRVFLEGMAALRAAQEQSQAHQQPSMTSASASSSSRRPRPPGLVTPASRSSPSSASKRPRSPPKPSSSSKGAYVD